MNSIAIPIRIAKGGLARTENVKEAIDNSLGLLTATPCHSSPADPDYGFIFNNLRFEILNEDEGVVFDSAPGRERLENSRGLYEKKVSGSSKNLNTFASALKEAIERYETRLENVSVSMTYVREERKIYVSVKGNVREDGTPYLYTSVIHVWK